MSSRTRRVYFLALGLLLLSLGGWAAYRYGDQIFASQHEGVVYQQRSIAEMTPADLAANTMQAGHADQTARLRSASNPSLPTAQRSLRRKVWLSLRVDDVAAFAVETERLVAGLGGYVESANVTRASGDDKTGGRADLVLRVPAEQYLGTIDHLTGASVEVINRRSTSDDVTDQLVDTQARITNLEAAETQMRTILADTRETSQNVERVLRVHAELTRLREQIERLKAGQAALQGQVNYVQMTITLLGQVPPQTQVAGPTWAAGDTFAYSAGLLMAVGRWALNALVFVGVFVLPVGVCVVVPVWVAWVALRRLARVRSTQASAA